MRMKNSYLCFICIASLIFIGAISKWLTFMSLVGSCFCAVIISQKHSHTSICKGIIFLLIIQNLCIGLGAHLLANRDNSLKLLTQIPFMVITIIWILKCVIGMRRKLDKDQIYFVAFLLCIFLAFLINHGNVQAVLVTLRNLMVFYMVYGIGRKAILSVEEIRDINKFIILCSLVLSLLGFIIMVGGYPLYRALGIHEVYIAKAAGFAEGGLDGRFYTSLFSTKSYIRMGSILYEPINLSYMLAIGLICATLNNPWKNIKKLLSIAVIGTGLLLTFGKGGYIIAGLTFMFIFAEKTFKRLFKRIGKKTYSLFIILLACICVYTFVQYYISHIGLAVLNHIFGIQKTFANVLKQPWGYGMGTGGNAAFSVGNSTSDWLSSGGETALMSFMYQIGVQGVLFLLLIFIQISRKLVLRKTLFERAFFFIPYILLFVSLMQDNTFTPQCITLYMMMLGGLSNVDLSLSSQKWEEHYNVIKLRNDIGLQ